MPPSNTPPPPADLAHFRTHPWCATLLDDPSYTISDMTSRHAKPSTEDLLFGLILKTPSTISHCVIQIPHPKSPTAQVPSLRALLALGKDLNGYPHVCHGGIVATILDEAMGVLIGARQARAEELAVREGKEPGRVPTSLTGELSVRYLRPVATPQAVLVRVEVEREEGRKIWLVARMEDGEGVRLAEGRAVFIQMREERDKGRPMRPRI
ncbi:hypothetical protein EJ06DRAFT_526506 [Trichodelitschia bisporula]|uniref:Thioesterase domain-containing protein n=1 Tax=Trichodelitschia bisporula TaxID=703511 RepID=A0A6G1I7Z9_9PEZI|nr:hypothetical protein EJ06DRAFT_526506 [Trichodelitschia bisporula]